MIGDTLHGWGLRVRIPPDYEPEPLRRSERAIVGFLVSVALELAWLGYLALASPSFSDPRAIFLVPFALTAVPLTLALGLPGSVVRLCGIEALLALSRESGGLRRWDRSISLLSVVILGSAIYYVSEPFRPSLVLLAVDALAASFCLAVLQPRVDFTTRRWEPKFPSWILKPAEAGAIVGPDPGAAPVYDLTLSDGTRYPIGVAIPGDVLERLRKANRDAEGRLFRNDLFAAILADRDPVDGVGRDELLRLCAQLASVAAERALTPFACANLVLGFVQDAIRYEYDEDSTTELEAGPFDEYGRFALETVHDRVGDCDCTSILCAALLTYLGFSTAFILLRLDDPEDGVTHHVAVGLAADDALLAGVGAADGFDTALASDGSGRRYLYGETAVDGMRVAFGDLPSEWRRIMKVEAVLPIPAPRPARQ